MHAHSITSIFVLLVLTAFPVQAQQETPHEFTFERDGKAVVGTVLDNYPPVYAIIRDADDHEHLVDYPALMPESATRLAALPALRYSPDAMPEIKDVTSSTNAYSTLDLVHFKDGKTVAGIVERPRFTEYLILRWPSGEEWLCYYDDIDSVSQVDIHQPVTFQEFRHYYSGVSSTLSFLVPGLGHIYNGEYVMAGVHVGFLASVVGLSVLTMDHSKHLGLSELFLFMYTVIGVHVFDAADAWHSSDEFEKRRADWQKSRCLYRERPSPYSMEFGLTPLPNGGAAGITIRF